MEGGAQYRLGECGNTRSEPAILEAKVLVGVMAHQQGTETPKQRTWAPARNLLLPAHKPNWTYYCVRMRSLSYPILAPPSFYALFNPSFCHFSPFPDDDTRISVETLNEY